MALSPAQLPALKASIEAETDPTFVGYRTNGQTPLMTAWYNAASTFVVFKTSEPTASLGKTINYVAFEALTTANLEKFNTFRALNPDTLNPAKSDVRTFFANVFSGALGGQGQATRDALEALWRRFATRAEKLYVTGPGTGTTVDPGTLVFQGSITDADISAALAL